MNLKYILAFCMVCYALPVTAQQATPFTVSGTIHDSATQQPVAGATVSLAASRTKAISKHDGSFSLLCTKDTDILYARYTGYTTFTETVHTGTPAISILVAPNEGQLETVTVNTGYQRLQKERSTGSYDVINKALINRSVSTGILTRIENVSPGILFNHGDAAKSDPLLIRGRSTIYANASPLIVVDNFPYDGDINNINPNDVESITILKDAAAASIWGARAGNGVIVITTKKGNSAKPSVELNINTTVTGKPDLFNINQVSGSDYTGIERYLYGNGFYDWMFDDPYHTAPPPAASLLHEAATGVITPEEADDRIKAMEGHDVRNDLQRYFYRQEVRQQYAFNVSGKNERTAYYFSAGYDKNLPALTGSSFDRISLRSNNSYQVARRLELNAGINFTLTDNKTGNNSGYDYSSPLQSRAYYPYAQLADGNGKALPVYEDYSKAFTDTAGQGLLKDWTNRPLDDITAQTTTAKTTDYVVYAGFNFSISSHLKLEARYQYENETISNTVFYSAASYFTRNLVNNFAQPDLANRTVQYVIADGAIQDVSDNSLTAHQGRAQLSFNQGWNNDKHQLSAIAGFEIRSAVNEGNNFRVYGYDKEHNTADNQTDFHNYYPQYSNPDYRSIPNNLYLTGNTDHFLSYYSNVLYSFKNRYSVTGSARIDEANLFGVKTNQKGTPLWSTGMGWIISRENFYRIGWLPYLKLRLTYGYNGNISRQATAYTTVQYNTGALTPLPIAFITNPGNPNLRWEKTGTFNAGIDFSTRNERLGGSLEFYTKHSSDLTGNAPLDPTLGIGGFSNPSYYGNVANMSGRGVDIQLLSLNTKGAIEWRTNFIFSYAATRVTQYYAPLNNAGALYVVSNTINPVVNKPLFSVYSYAWAGLDPENGNPRGYVNGKVSEDYSAIYSNTPLDSMVFNGPSEPTVYGAIRNEFSFKQFSLSFNISYKTGYYFRMKSVVYSDLFYNWNGSGDFAKRWQKPGDEQTTHVPSMIYPVDYYRDFFYPYSDILVTKADAIRFEDINVSYTLMLLQWKRLPAQQLKLFVYASNLGVLWKANHAAIDPYFNDIARTRSSIAFGLNIYF